FSALPLVNGSADALELQWFCDSQYVLKSATEYIHNWLRNGWKTASKKPVKNQALWRAYVGVRERIKVNAHHVYGHTGHPENEACDSAATWARFEAATHLELSGDGSVVESLPEHANGSWFVIDGRPYLKLLRQSEGEELSDELIYSLRGQLEKHKLHSVDRLVVSKADLAERTFLDVCEKIQVISKELAKIENDYSPAQELKIALREALKMAK
ncbi:UNVERIFIED_CONTAM: hypothetical protein GTU68_004717, partial [Idotea baltica]|nr:hypothetical protein [Idotea baltica]